MNNTNVLATHQRSSRSSIYEDGTYLKNIPDWHSGDAAWKGAHIVRMLEKHALHPRSAVDVGCGAGGIIDAVARAFPDCAFEGYDISPQAIDLGLKRNLPNASFHLGLPSSTEPKYDLAMAIDVAEHVEDCFGFLRNTAALAPYQIYHIPLDLSVQVMLRPERILEVRRVIGHIHSFTLETALEILDDTGHRVIDWFFTAGAVELEMQSRKQRLAAIPRRLLFKLNQRMAARWLGGYSILVLCDAK